MEKDMKHEMERGLMCCGFKWIMDLLVPVP